jgi:uncharacterized protein YdeI (YjbR/CyaY-like superfamily)
MGKKDPRVDAYIAKSADFARPILAHLRSVVHAACPDVEETMKWSAPHFMYNGMLCSMAAFKGHCAFGFWKGALVVDEGDRRDGEAAGQFGRITSVSDLPPKKKLAGYVKRAMELNDAGVESPTRAPRRPKPELTAPDDLAAALRKNKAARAAFEGFSPSHRREYIEWITDAKRPETRERRFAQLVEACARGERLERFSRP